MNETKIYAQYSNAKKSGRPSLPFVLYWLNKTLTYTTFTAENIF